MLSERIQTIRKSKGLSQEQLAAKLNVVRQTVSKWEKGLSVPDADLLIALSEALETPVSTLLGRTSPQANPDPADALSLQQELQNLQRLQRKATAKRILHWVCGILCILLLLGFVGLLLWDSPYLEWGNDDPERTVFAAAFHTFEWLFMRTAPFLFIASAVGLVLTRKKS